MQQTWQGQDSRVPGQVLGNKLQLLRAYNCDSSEKEATDLGPQAMLRCLGLYLKHAINFLPVAWRSLATGHKPLAQVGYFN